MILSIFILSFIISLVLIFQLMKVRNVSISKPLILGTILVSFRLFIEVVSHIPMDDSTFIMFQKLKLISPILIPPLYLMFAYEYAVNKPLTLKANLIIFIVPILSILSNLFGFPYIFFDNLMIKNFDFPLLIFDMRFGFNLHTYYSYFIIGIVCIIFLYRAIVSPKLYRKQSIFIFTGSILSISINFIVLIFIYNNYFLDTTSITMLFTLLILYWGVFKMSKSVMVPIARNLIIENIKDITIVLDISSRIIDVNPAFKEFLKRYSGKTQNINMYGLYISNLIKDESFLNLITSNSSDEQTITLNVGAFEEFYRIYTTDIVDKDSRTIGRLIRLHDITVIQEYTNHLSLVNNELIMTDRIIESAMEGILVTDEKAHIIRVNYALEKMSGFSNIELIGENPRLFKSNVHNSEFYEKMWFELIEYGYWEGEIWDKRKNGELYPKWMSITSLKNEEGEIQNYIAISSDISKMKKAENDLHSLSNYDPLTGLPNKNLFYQKLDDSIIRASETKSSTALIFIGWAIIN